MKKISLAIIIASSLCVWSCTKDSTTATTSVDCTTVSAKFAADVKPIFTGTKCATSGCHPANGDLSTHGNIVSHKDHVQQYVVNRTGSPMPPSGSVQLTTDEKNKVACWLQNGAKND